MKVYDAFLFFNELDLLEIRLNLLNDHVDHFILSECDITFSGKPKPLYYLENKERFKQFEHKIIHQVVTDTPTDFVHLKPFEEPKTDDEACVNMILEFVGKTANFPRNQPHWGRDFFQRECLHRALRRCPDEDVVMFSDIDEIPDPRTVSKVLSLFPSDDIYTLRQKEFNYFINMYKQDNWRGTRIARYSTLKKMSLNQIRTIIPGNRTLIDTIDIQDGGWHFTSVGGIEKVIHKIESWGHQEFNTEKVKKNVRKNIEAGKDVFFREGPPMKYVPITEEHYPKWLVDNIGRYPHLVSPRRSNRVTGGSIRDFFRRFYTFRNS